MTGAPECHARAAARHFGETRGRIMIRPKLNIAKVIRHVKVGAVKEYDRRELGFDGYAGKDFL